ncbi:hypothetical protein OUZ56_017183 [Daphnia magna]|uniref:Uncharacterized protein n=1 Tax=Daphnia magna TaxID=35525 RepID=A0ABR0ASC2_9CRUS|nr:hypothetical protein OUZ56_017183 [Daphnia magna]
MKTNNSPIYAQKFSANQIPAGTPGETINILGPNNHGIDFHLYQVRTSDFWLIAGTGGPPYPCSFQNSRALGVRAVPDRIKLSTGVFS